MGFIPDEGGPVAARDVSVTNEDFKNQQEVDDFLLRKNLVLGISHAHGVRLKGSTLVDVRVSWTANKKLVSQALDGTGISPATVRTKLFPGIELRANRTFTITATAILQAPTTETTSASCTVFFSNERAWGIAGAGQVSQQGIDGIMSQNKDRPAGETKAHTFTVRTGAGQYVYFMLPARLGIPTFNVGGFDGGFILEGVTTWENAAGFTESYNVFRSLNPNLGTTTVIAR